MNYGFDEEKTIGLKNARIRKLGTASGKEVVKRYIRLANREEQLK